MGNRAGFSRRDTRGRRGCGGSAGVPAVARAARGGTILAVSVAMTRVRVLVVYASERAGTDALARKLVDVLTGEGVGSEARAADDVEGLDAFDGVAVGGARDGGHWHRFARQFARRHASELRRLPTLFLSSGDGAGDALDLDRVRQLAHVLATNVGAPATAPATDEVIRGPATYRWHHGPGHRRRCPSGARRLKPARMPHG
jgi:menaquinone-dependent protoporphyrinogen IX oxidase